MCDKLGQGVSVCLRSSGPRGRDKQMPYHVRKQRSAVTTNAKYSTASRSSHVALSAWLVLSSHLV
jgi:hypothetical protein